MLHALIMAGGAGTRFWPESRQHRPKQLLPLGGEQTLLQQTLDRLQGLVPPQQVLVMTNHSLVEAVRAQLPQLPGSNVLGEPCKRDTAPCIGLAAFWFLRQDPQALMLVLPADHVISPAEQFHLAVNQAVALVQQQLARFVTFGIRPHYPAETFGYIQHGEPITAPGLQLPCFHVRQFHEKPKAEVARRYLQAGTYYWNSGIFLWPARAILQALQEHEPQMYRLLEQIARSFGTQEFADTFRRCFEAIQGVSIDYAVMEKAQGVAVIEAPFSWDDLGSWRAWARLRGTDAQGNAVQGRFLGLESNDLIVRTQDEHLIAALGVQGLIIVHTPDVTLVASQDQEESIRRLVQELERRGWTQYL